MNITNKNLQERVNALWAELKLLPDFNASDEASLQTLRSAADAGLLTKRDLEDAHRQLVPTITNRSRTSEAGTTRPAKRAAKRPASMSLQDQVDALWTDLEAQRPLASDELSALRKLDDAAIDGKLAQSELSATQAELNAPPLYGDYELIIDTCLKGDPKVKAEVRAADNGGRRGLSVLKKHLSAAKVKPKASLADIMRSCEHDQSYYNLLQKDTKGLTQRSGAVRVRYSDASRNPQTASFPTLKEARSFRDAAKASADLEAYSRLSGPRQEEREAKSIAVLKEASRVAEMRKVELTKAMRPDPRTGEIPSWPAVLRKAG